MADVRNLNTSPCTPGVDRLMSAEEVSANLFTKDTHKALCLMKAGLIPFLKVGKKHVVRTSDFNKFLCDMVGKELTTTRGVVIIKDLATGKVEKEIDTVKSKGE